MAEHGHPEPRPIPPQEDFPVEWAAPEEQMIPWQLDKMHFPNAMPPLESEFWTRFMHGMHEGMVHYEMPVQAAAKVFNYWVYLGIFPSVPLEKMQEQGMHSDKLVMATVHGLQERWDTEWLPEIKEYIDRWEAFDLPQASTAELLAHFEQVWEESSRLWAIHFETVIGVYISLALFDDLHHDLFAEDGAFDSHRLLEGHDNTSLQLGRALWELSRKAAASDEIRKIIQDNAPGDVIEALGTSTGVTQFKEELDGFLDAYGQRGSMWGICHTSWLEDPGPVIVNLKDYLDQAEDPTGQLDERAAEREEAIATVRQRLEGYPAAVRDEFEGLLKAASAAVVLTEDHGFWIDFRACYDIRMVVMELGRRLATSSAIETASDIFFLSKAEISAAAAAESAPDHAAAVRQRKSELEHFNSLNPPMFMGTDYGPPPPGLVTSAFGKFFGMPPAPSDSADTLNGNAGSPGKVTGTARIISSLDDSDRLKPGDVLVAETTAPPWTPLFATAAAIVTNTGGILSHCAVVAREYRIPAVVGTGMATHMIKDGQTIEVDGDLGIVRIVG
jgi:pyruvate,water dikinase